MSEQETVVEFSPRSFDHLSRGVVDLPLLFVLAFMLSASVAEGISIIFASISTLATGIVLGGFGGGVTFWGIALPALAIWKDSKNQNYLPMTIRFPKGDGVQITFTTTGPVENIHPKEDWTPEQEDLWSQAKVSGLYVFVLHVVFRQITIPFTSPVKQPCADIVCLAEGPAETEIDWQMGVGAYKGIAASSNSVCPLDVRVLTANRWEKDGLPVPIVRILGSRGQGDRAEKGVRMKAFSQEDLVTAKQSYVANKLLPLQLLLEEKDERLQKYEDAEEDKDWSEGQRIGTALDRRDRATGVNTVRSGAADWFKKNPKWAIVTILIVSGIVALGIWALVTFNHPPPTIPASGH